MLPQEGFLKIGVSGKRDLAPGDRAALIRKGNQFFNSGNVELAKRIFISTGYSDGLIRVGDRCMEQGKPMEALRLYWLAPAPDKVDNFMEKTAGILRKWLQEGE